MKIRRRASVTTSTSTGDGLRIADTSFLYALFSKTDVFHSRAREEAMKADPVVVPAEILSETLALIHYRRGFASARAAGLWIRSKGLIQIGIPSRRLVARAWQVFASGRGRWSYPDSVVLAWCAERAATPLAFDSALLRPARK